VHDAGPPSPVIFVGPLPESYDEPFFYVVRLLTGSVMALSLYLGVAAVLPQTIAQHEAWMIRAYTLELGAGTQVSRIARGFCSRAFEGSWRGHHAWGRAGS
jgi:hypothetical protein